MCMKVDDNKQLVYEIRGKEYEGSHHIETTMFLEICRITMICSEVLYAYKNNKEFRKQVDFSLDSVKPTDIGIMFLATRLQNVVCGYLAEHLEPNELGEEESDSEDEDN